LQLFIPDRASFVFCIEHAKVKSLPLNVCV
jgi:hypothetical protein